MRFIELFAGIGGFRYGLEGVQSTDKELLRPATATGGTEGQPIELDNGSAERLFTCVWANEIDKYACQIYRKNYREGELYEGDITKVKATDIPDHDLLVGGFPCQAFSIAGKRLGFHDTRGTLFYEIARILTEKRPRYLLLENVKGLLSHENGRTFSQIIGILSDIGYDLQWEVLNSKNFGVPQNRERVFIVGHLRGTSRPEVFPIGGTNEIHTGEVANCLDANYHKGWLDHGQRTMIKQTQKLPDAQRVRETDGLSVTLKGEGGGQGAKTGLYVVPCLTPDRAKKRQNGRRFKEHNDPMFTLTGQDIHGILERKKDSLNRNMPIHRAKNCGNFSIRRLTPTECCRLQGFPDDWVDGISDSQKYKCLGNAVTTNVITEIGRRLV